MIQLEGKELAKKLSNSRSGFRFLFQPRDVILHTLGETKGYLQMIDQPQAVVSLLMKAFDKSRRLKHTNMQVIIMVTTCLSKFLRIFAPKALYDDVTLRIICQLLVHNFEGLKDVTYSHFSRRVAILETFVKNRMGCILIVYRMVTLYIDIPCNYLIMVGRLYPRVVICML